MTNILITQCVLYKFVNIHDVSKLTNFGVFALSSKNPAIFGQTNSLEPFNFRSACKRSFLIRLVRASRIWILSSSKWRSTEVFTNFTSSPALIHIFISSSFFIVSRMVDLSSPLSFLTPYNVGDSFLILLIDDTSSIEV